jgi:hypothetical protein
MIRNMGTIDRAARLIIAVVALYIAFAVATGGALFWVALAVGVIFTATALVGNCPLYRIVGLKTCRDC